MIKVTNLTKKYRDFTAVENVSFDVKKGEIFGLLGPNGSGKTTILEILIGLKKPTQGSVSVFKLDPFKNRKKLAGSIGVQLDYTNLPLNIKTKEAVELFASFYKNAEIDRDILHKFGLNKKQNSIYGSLSWGEKQRLGLALACLHSPEILFLDEPTSRLDPIGKEEITGIIRDFKKENKTVFMNTHDLQDAEGLCDRIGIMNKGRLCVVDTPEKLIKGIGYEFRITVSGLLSNKVNFDGTKVVQTRTNTHIFTNQPDRIVQHLVRLGKDFNKASIGLADVFLIYAGEEYHE